MSSSNFNGSTAFVRTVSNDGKADRNNAVNNTNGVRPVISLKSNTIFAGSGTKDDPYVVVE